jgi:hypothetical protein
MMLAPRILVSGRFHAWVLNKLGSDQSSYCRLAIPDHLLHSGARFRLQLPSLLPCGTQIAGNVDKWCGLCNLQES